MQLLDRFQQPGVRPGQAVLLGESGFAQFRDAGGQFGGDGVHLLAQRDGQGRDRKVVGGADAFGALCGRAFEGGRQGRQCAVETAERRGQDLSRLGRRGAHGGEGSGHLLHGLAHPLRRAVGRRGFPFPCLARGLVDPVGGQLPGAAYPFRGQPACAVHAFSHGAARLGELVRQQPGTGRHLAGRLCGGVYGLPYVRCSRPQLGHGRLQSLDGGEVLLRGPTGLAEEVVCAFLDIGRLDQQGPQSRGRALEFLGEVGGGGVRGSCGQRLDLGERSRQSGDDQPPFRLLRRVPEAAQHGGAHQCQQGDDGVDDHHVEVQDGPEMAVEALLPQGEERLGRAGVGAFAGVPHPLVCVGGGPQPCPGDQQRGEDQYGGQRMEEPPRSAGLRGGRGGERVRPAVRGDQSAARPHAQFVLAAAVHRIRETAQRIAVHRTERVAGQITQFGREALGFVMRRARREMPGDRGGAMAAASAGRWPAQLFQPTHGAPPAGPGPV